MTEQEQKAFDQMREALMAAEFHLVEVGKRGNGLHKQCEDALTAANAVQQQGKACGWLYDWTHSSATGRDDETYTTFTTDKAHALKHENVRAVYAHPQATEPAAPEAP